MPDPACDTCVIGAGVLGLAVARAVARRHRGSVFLLERNTRIGEENSSRNSEVIHAGLYYPTESLKAHFCREGRELLYEYCQRYGIPHRKIGKLIVAQRGEGEALQRLADNAAGNGIDETRLRHLDRSALRGLEPAVEGDCALLSTETGIIDAHALMQSLLQQAEVAGATLVTQTEVRRITPLTEGFLLHTGHPDGSSRADYRLSCRNLVLCAGLHARKLASCIDTLPKNALPELQWIKGSYFTYSGRSPFTRLIYPLPPASGQGLGIHATLDLAGGLRFGPDAQPVEHIDFSVDASARGQFVDAIRRYYPDIDAERLQPGYAGIRPRTAGAAPADFAIGDGASWSMPGLIQLSGIESPGLTASLALAEHVAEQLQLTAR